VTVVEASAGVATPKLPKMQSANAVWRPMLRIKAFLLFMSSLVSVP